MTNAVAVVLFAGVVLYAVFGGADFGAGFWDLTAGGAETGRRPRERIEHSLGPVWEANHVWLVFCLVVLWTGFPRAFAAIMSTLYVPLGLAALGIVLRGSGFAFRKVSSGLSQRRLNGAMFAASSVVTPFFLGTVAGGIASGRVPSAGNGNGFTSWVNPTSILGGTLAVVVCAYLAAVFLTQDARLAGERDLEEYFRRRVFLAAAAAGVLAVIGIFVLHADAHHLYERLLTRGLALVLVSAAAGIAVVVLLGRVHPRLVRVLGVGAVATVVMGWGVAAYPNILGTHLTLKAAAAPHATLATIAVVFVFAVLLCVPSLVLLYVLQQRGDLDVGSFEP